MYRFTIQIFLVLLAGWFCWPSSASGQRDSTRGDGTPPKNSLLTTKDGVRLGITYYASDKGREAVPVVLLHDHKESRVVFNGLATALQNPADPDSPSLAVITPDFRGHG